MNISRISKRNIYFIIKTSEIVCIHIGEGGIGVGKYIWELFTLEHNIQKDGFLSTNTFPDENENLYPFFSETKEGKYYPRALFMDLEASVIDELRISDYRKLYHPEQYIIGGMNSSGNNYGNGFNKSNDLLETSIERIRKLTKGIVAKVVIYIILRVTKMN